MSIYTTEQIVDRAKEMSRDQLIDVVERIVNSASSRTMKSNFARIIMGETKKDSLVFIDNDRTIPLRALMTLNDSPLIDYVRPIIEAALDLRGPYQSTEILLVAAQIKGGKAFYITKDGVPQNYKNQAGHILSMAGFERVSHYDRETKRPIKAWKSKHGWAHMTVEDRENEFWNKMDEVKTTPKKAKAPKKPNLLESFL